MRERLRDMSEWVKEIQALVYVLGFLFAVLSFVGSKFVSAKRNIEMVPLLETRLANVEIKIDSVLDILRRKTK